MSYPDFKIGEKYVWLDPDGFDSKVIILEKLETEGSLFKGRCDSDEVKSWIIELRKLDEVTCCKKCGNIDLHIKAWVNNNTKQYIEFVDDEEAYCTDCDTTVKEVLVSEYLEDEEPEKMVMPEDIEDDNPIDD